jgi:putative transposase
MAAFSGVRSLTFMSFLEDWLKSFRHLIRTACCVVLDFLRLFVSACRSRRAVEAENLFLRKQLALFQERQTKPRRAGDSTRWLMGFVSRWFDWRNALVVVQPETLIRWHRKGFRLFWRWKSRPTGRPRLPKDIQALIRQMATENPTWGEEHIANELKLKLGIRVSPRTVGKYLAQGPRRKPDPSQRWLTFVRNHAQAIVACDFFVVVTARFRILYVLVVVELGRRRILHINVTDHPSAEWTQQQLREALPGDHPFRFLIHDRDSIYSQELDQAVAAMGVRVLRTPPQAPQTNSVCERLIGTIRRECLDFLIPLGHRHLKDILNRWARHYNQGRVHMSLGPGIPAPIHPSPPKTEQRHRLPQGYQVHRRAVLGGLHHEYWLEKVAA